MGDEFEEESVCEVGMYIYIYTDVDGCEGENNVYSGGRGDYTTGDIALEAWNLERMLSALPFLSVTSDTDVEVRAEISVPVVSIEGGSARVPNAGDGGAVDDGDQSGLTVSLFVDMRYGVDAEERVPGDEFPGDEWPVLKKFVSAGELWTRLLKNVEKVDERRDRLAPPNEVIGSECECSSVRGVGRSSWLPRRLSLNALETPSERDWPAGQRGAAAGVEGERPKCS